MTYQEITKQIRGLEVKPEDRQIKTAILEALKNLSNLNKQSNKTKSKNDAILTALREAKPKP